MSLLHPFPGRIARPLAALLASLTLGAAALPSAQTGLVRVGPLDPVTGYPRWYEDSNGLKLGMCDDPNLCFFFPPNPALPTKFPAFDGDPTANFPEEFFYWAGEASMSGNGGAQALLVMALEGAFLGGPVKIGDQVVFARIRLRITGLAAGATYTVTHPYGVESLVADGGTINMTRDIGIGTLGDFTGALAGDVGPFLTPVGFAGGPQGTFISDGAALVPVQGSPITVGGVAANFFRIEGPNAGLVFAANVHPNPALGPDPTTTSDCAEIAQFTLQGQIARQFGVSSDRHHYLKSPTQTSVNAWATSTSGQALRISVDGSATVGMRENGTTGEYFARIELGASAPRPTQLTIVNTSDNPPTEVVVPLADLVTGVSAVYVMGGDVTVQAETSDLTALPTLRASVPGRPSVALIPSGNGISVGGLGLPPNAVPPKTVTVTSDGGGTLTIPIKVIGVGSTPGGVTLVADAGVDRTVAPNTPVSLDGSGSLGPIASFQWTHDAGAAITLTGAGTATPSFTSPNVAAPLDITFTLTVRNAENTLTASDTLVVHVVPPPPAEVLTLNVARYLRNKATWRVDGTSTITTPHTVSVYLGPVGNTARKIADIEVTVTGAFRVALADNAATATGTVPGAGDTTIWARSSLSGATASRAIEFR